MKNLIKKFTLTFPYAASVIAMTASADLGVLQSGTVQLIDDVSSAMQAIVAVAGGASVCYCFIRKSMADDVDQKKWQSRIITSVIATVGGLLTTTIINIVAGYYGA